MDDVLSLKEAAQAIGVPYESVRYWYREGLLPVRRIAGRVLIDPKVLRATLAELGYRPKRKRTSVAPVGAAMPA